MTVPMYASIASVVIALIPPLQSVLGRTKPLVQAIKSAGQCSSACGEIVQEDPLLTWPWSPPPHSPDDSGCPRRILLHPASSAAGGQAGVAARGAHVRQ